ncbi:hypothetical protein NDK47_20750 [Brevibacillus ruminantium]|uniref:Uncharacterized protein n=1 Tax=Brevibacillus ruminantium TaxID=2950604 RepID=A0ABY4WCC5_9BACL|nr:hypothetical protein [Brevibacillus ruminantium]USG64554.1 hypothetical protein NDK47_20750 [Brevibacillus ruminantium]
MKKVLGIGLMAVLLGVNAYIWPALFKSVAAESSKAKTENRAGNKQIAAAGTDFSNQDPTQTKAVFDQLSPKEETVSPASVLTAQETGEKKQTQTAAAPAKAAAKKPAQKASPKKASPKKAAPTPKQATANSQENASENPSATPSDNLAPIYTDDGLYVTDYGSYRSNWVELSDGSLLRKSDGVRAFNLPFEKNPYTGEIKPYVEPMSQAAYQMYQSQQAGFQPSVTTHYSNPR